VLAPSDTSATPAPRPASTESPEATLGGFFHHKKAAPKPSPSPSASASP